MHLTPTWGGIVIEFEGRRSLPSGAIYCESWKHRRGFIIRTDNKKSTIIEVDDTIMVCVRGEFVELTNNNGVLVEKPYELKLDERAQRIKTLIDSVASTR